MLKLFPILFFLTFRMCFSQNTDESSKILKNIDQCDNIEASFITHENICTPCCVEAINGLHNQFKKDFNAHTKSFIILEDPFEIEAYKNQLIVDTIFTLTIEEIKDIGITYDDLPCMILHNHNHIYGLIKNIRTQSHLYDSLATRIKEEMNSIKRYPIKINETKDRMITTINSLIVRNDNLFILDQKQNSIFTVCLINGEIIDKISPPDSLNFHFYDKDSQDFFWWNHLSESYKPSPLINFINLFDVSQNDILTSASFFSNYEILSPKEVNWFKVRAIIQFSNKIAKVIKIDNQGMILGNKSVVIQNEIYLKNYVEEIHNSDMAIISKLEKRNKDEYVLIPLIKIKDLETDNHQNINEYILVDEFNSGNYIYLLSLSEMQIYKFDIDSKIITKHILDIGENFKKEQYFDSYIIENEIIICSYNLNSNEIIVHVKNMINETSRTYNIPNVTDITQLKIIPAGDGFIKLIVKSKKDRWKISSIYIR